MSWGDLGFFGSKWVRSGERRSQERRTMEKGRIHLGDNITSDLGGKKRRRWSSPCGAVDHRVQGTEDQRHLCRKTLSVLTISSNMNKYSSRNILFQICKKYLLFLEVPASSLLKSSSQHRSQRLASPCKRQLLQKERKTAIHCVQNIKIFNMYKISKYPLDNDMLR